MSENEFNQFVDAARSLDQSKFFIDDTPALLISSIASKARRLKRTHGLDFLIIDYLQLIRASSNKENRVNEIAEITQGLKAIAKELNIPVLAYPNFLVRLRNREDKDHNLLIYERVVLLNKMQMSFYLYSEKNIIKKERNQVTKIWTL